MIDEPTDVRVRIVSVLTRAVRSVPELRRGFLLTLLLAIVGASGRLAIPLLLARAIDRGLRDNSVDMGVIRSLSLIGLGIALISTLSASLARYRLGVQSERAMATLRRTVTDRILSLSTAQHGSQRRGVLVARITGDVETLARFFEWGALSWLMNIGVFLVIGIAMLVMDLQLALVAIGCTIPILLFTFWINGPVIKAFVTVREHIGRYLAGASELVSAAPLVRAYNAEESLGGQVLGSISQRRRGDRRAHVLGAVQFVAVDFVTVFAVCAVALVALSRRDDPSLTAGTVVGFLFLVRAFIDPIMDIGESLFDVNRAAAGMNRILDLVDLPADVSETTRPTPLPAGSLGIELAGVDYEYPPRDGEPPSADSFALRDINLVIEAGETVAFVGATGSGKSTLAKLVVRAADPTVGTVRIGGVALPEVASDVLRQRVQLVPQEPFLFDTTIAENVRLADERLQTDDVRQLLDQVGLTEWIQALPLGLDTVVGERGELLSAGERQLVALARAGAANPDVLVLDEATSAVDAATEAQLAATLEAISQGRTTIIIAHRLTTVARADRVAVVDHGRIVEVGRPAELASRADGHYARLVRSWEKATRGSG
jgi:ATP-binding cassette, subfamily B, bacterial